MIHTFEAEFPKPAGSRLGIQLSLVNTTDREGLVVEKVAEGGAVDAYNKKSPEGYRVQEGDLVVKVNGVAADGPLAHHMPAIAGKVMEASTIRLEVRRYCAGPNIPGGGGLAATGMSQPGADTDAQQNAMGRPWKAGMQSQTSPFLGLDPTNAPDSQACGQAPNQADVDNLLMQGQMARAMGMPLGGAGCPGVAGGCGCPPGGCPPGGCGGCCGCRGCGCPGYGGGCGCGCGGCGGGCCGGCQGGCNSCGCGGCGCGCGGCGPCGGCGACGGCGCGCGGCPGGGMATDNSISGIQSGLAQLQQQLQLQQQQLQQQVIQSQANVMMSPPPPPPLPPTGPQMPRTPAQLPMNINALSNQAVQLQQKIAQLQQQLGLMGFAEGQNQVQGGPMTGEEEQPGGEGGIGAFNQGRAMAPQTPPDAGLAASQQMLRNLQQQQPAQPPPPQHPPKLQAEKAQEAPSAVPADSNNFTFEVYLQRLEGMRLGLSVLPVTMHDVAALWVNDVSEGGAVDAWNKSVCPAFQVRSGDAITKVFDAAGDHAKMMEELQSHRNIRLAVLRQGGSGVQQNQSAPAPAAPQAAPPPKAAPKPSAAQFSPPLQKALPAQLPRQDDLGQASSRPLGMAGGLPEAALAPPPPTTLGDDDAQKAASVAPPGLPMPLNAARNDMATTDDPGDLFGSIDIEETGANGLLRFKVVLARKGPGRLGIDVVLKREANFCGLLVYTVSEGGRVDAWNKQSQLPYRVLPGDHILEVNDISISGDSNAQNDKFAVRMIQELSKDQKNVHFTVERAQTALGEELVLPQDDESLLLAGMDSKSRKADSEPVVISQTAPRQVGAQKPEEKEDSDAVEGGRSAPPKAAEVPSPTAVASPKAAEVPSPTAVASGPAKESDPGLPPGMTPDSATPDGETEGEDVEKEEDQVAPASEEPEAKTKISIPAPPSGPAPPPPEAKASPGQ